MAVVYEGIVVTTPIGRTSRTTRWARAAHLRQFLHRLRRSVRQGRCRGGLCFTLGELSWPARGGRRRPGIPALGVAPTACTRPISPASGRSSSRSAPARARFARILLRAPLSQRAPEAATCASRSPKGGDLSRKLRYRAPLVEGSVVWERLTGEPENQDVAISALFIGDDAKASVYALAEIDCSSGPGKPTVLRSTSRSRWSISSRLRTGHRCGADHDEAEADRRVRVVLADARESPSPGRARGVAGARARAWARAIDPKDPELYIAGFEGEPSSAQASQPITLIHIRGGKAEVSRPGECEVLPIAFERRPWTAPAGAPALVVATERPTRFVAQQRMAGPATLVQEAPRAREALAPATKSTAAGCSAPLGRPWSSMPISACFTGHSEKPEIDGRTRYVADAARVLDEARYLVFEGAAEGEGFLLLADREGNRLLEPTPRGAELHRGA